MNYCPSCGKKLTLTHFKGKEYNQCECGYFDWNNWVHVSAVVVGYNNQNEFLMIQLKKEGNKLTFPGGFRDLGESIEEAATREFWEETGLTLTNLSLFNVYSKDDIRLVWIVFTANVLEGNFVENEETEGFAFYSINNPPSLERLRGSLTKQLLMDVLNYKHINKK
jgi:8-oxo-dGTP pyrophosphatase MutT (NUDIX family)